MSLSPNGSIPLLLGSGGGPLFESNDSLSWRCSSDGGEGELLNSVATVLAFVFLTAALVGSAANALSIRIFTRPVSNKFIRENNRFAEGSKLAEKGNAV